jgi:peptide subunit release factor RF-3
MEHEYNAACTYRPIDSTIAHWIASDDPKALAAFIDDNARKILVDIRGTQIFMSDSDWTFERMKAKNPRIRFYATSDMVEDRDSSS